MHALKRVSLAVHEGDFLAIAGSSGSGKTTLLNLMGTLDRPSAGQVLIEGREIVDLSSKELSRLRRAKIGFIFQTFNLFPVLTAEENVEYPLLQLVASADERREAVKQALSKVGLDRFAAHRPDQLSGGQRSV